MKRKTSVISFCAGITAAVLASAAFAGCSEKNPYPLADGELLHEPVLTHTYDDKTGALSFTCICEACGQDFMQATEIGVYKEDDFIRLYELSNGSAMDLSGYESGVTYTFVPYNTYTDSYMARFEIRIG
ncbi:MAG: hypothetical protein LUD51_00975 [Clostridia bacterium]|nr:hypothetical protein [Clostridia bacterium]